MRVAYVCTDPGLPLFGNKGSSVHVQSVLGVLADRGVELHVLTTRPGGDAPPRLAGVHVHHLPISPVGSAELREAQARRTDEQVADTLAGIASHDKLDLVYERYSLWGRGATRWARANGVPSVLEVNAPLVEEQARHRVLVDRAGAERVAVEALSQAGTVICVSDAVADWARSRSLSPERVHSVANGVDTHRMQPAVVAPAEPPFTVGFVGSLKPWHGVEDLVRAMALLAGNDTTYRLLIIGEGPRTEAVRGLVHELGLQGMVEMPGAVAPHDVAALLTRVHVAVAPYPPHPDFYFSPLKIYEYLAAGIPTVATRVGALPEALGHGRLGVLVEPGDPAAMADAIAALRADPGRRRLLGKLAREAAVEHHDWNHVVSRILDLAAVAHDRV